MQAGISWIEYLGKVRERTMRVVRCIPPDRLEWSYREGQFTLGDLARHIAATGRYTFTKNILGRPSRYRGCGKELADGFEKVVSFMERLHSESVEIFSALSEDDWNGKCLTADGASITRWKLLRLMIEHEIHHRGQIYIYLGMLGVPAPPLYGLTSEQLAQRAANI